LKGDYGNIPAGGGKENKAKQSQFQYPANAPKERQETRVSGLFKIRIAGKLEFFDGFEILILTNAGCRFTIATETRKSKIKNFKEAVS